MTPKPTLQFHIQHVDGDCCITALAMITGIDYEDVLVQATKVILDKPPHKGLYFTEIAKVGQLLGYPMKFKKVCNFIKDKGILDVDTYHGYKFEARHAVVLMAGLIFDPGSGMVWLPKNYKSRYRAKFGGILVPV